MERGRTLRRWLETHVVRSPEERDARRRMFELLDRVTDPFSRSSFEPGHFTASAFVGSPELDAVLMVRHPTLGRWLQPGGHVEPHDRDLMATALREVVEETGLVELEPLDDDSPVFDLDIHEIPARGNEPCHLHYDVRFRFRVRRPLASGAGGAHETRWFPIAGLAPDTAMERALSKWRPVPGRKESTR